MECTQNFSKLIEVHRIWTNLVGKIGDKSGDNIVDKRLYKLVDKIVDKTNILQDSLIQSPFMQDSIAAAS